MQHNSKLSLIPHNYLEIMRGSITLIQETGSALQTQSKWQLKSSLEIGLSGSTSKVSQITLV